MDKKTQAKIRGLKRELEGCAKRIGIERDKMRELIGRYEEISTHANDAIDLIDDAVDNLSQLL